MGKASSSKKVARAAGLGGSRSYGSRPAWGYYFAIVVLVLLGVAGVYNSREYLDNQVNSNGSGQPSVHMATPWFEGYAVDICGKLQPSIRTTKDPYGITTDQPGIISIDPANKSVAGKNATLGKFASAVGMTLNAGELELPGGRLYLNDQTCEGKEGHVYVMAWTDPSEPPQDGVLQTKHARIDVSKGWEDTCDPDCDSGVLLENDQLVTIAFLPAPPKHTSLSVLQPSQSVIAALTKTVANGGTTTTAAPVTTPVTVKTTTAKSAKLPGSKTTTAKTTPAKTTTVTTAKTTTAKTTTAKTTTAKTTPAKTKKAATAKK